MTMGCSTALRTVWAQGMITEAGASAKFKFYNGTRPATGAAITSQTLGATLTMGTTIGTAGSGVIDIDEAGMTQNSANHVSMTPTWIRLTKSNDTFVSDFSIGADATFSSTIATNVNITMGTSTITMPNP